MRTAITDPISCTACHRGPAPRPVRYRCHPARATRVSGPTGRAPRPH